MGVVYAAVDQKTGRTFAIKRLFPSAMSSQISLARFLAEARVTARIEHPNVIGVIDVGNDEGTLFIVMERLRGESLAQRLRRGRMSVAETLDVVIATCSGVAEAHAEGVIHRDLKPDNIFLCIGKDGSPRPPKVLDFGIAKLFEGASLQDQITKSGYFVGTPGYMPREQIDSPREIDVRADVYAIGVVLYEALTGRLPYRANGLYDLVQQVSAGRATPIRELAPEVPAELQAIVMRAMSAAREDRHATMRELIEELKAVRARLGDFPPVQAMEASSDPVPTPVPTRALLPPTGGFADTAPRPPPQRARSAPRREAHISTSSTPGMPRAVRIVLAASAVVVLGSLVAGGAFAAFVLTRGGAGIDVRSAPRSGEDPLRPQVELRFSGECDPSFADRLEVNYFTWPHTERVCVVGRNVGSDEVSMICVMRYEPATASTFDLSVRAEGMAGVALLSVIHDRREWQNLDALMGRGSADLVRGHVRFSHWEPTNGRMDVAFEEVQLVQDGTRSTCRVNGRLRTFGLTYGR